jgi:mono/diheme cytochrome c family protein
MAQPAGYLRFSLPWLVIVLFLCPPSRGTPSPWEAAAQGQEARPKPSGSASALYNKRCARCHDIDGRARDLHDALPHAPDFTDPRWHQYRSTARLITSILDGKGSQMPAFGGKLTSNQAHELVLYVRSFVPAPVQEAGKPEDDFETRLRELQEEFERLRKQLDELSPKRKR